MARLTQKQLAERLGLSQATVSAVLSNSSSIKVSEATRKRILEAASKGGYWPNQLANALLARRTRMIGVVHVNAYHQVIIRKLKRLVEEIEAAGYLPMVFDIGSHSSCERICQFLRDLNLDALVMLNPTDSPFTRSLYPKYLAGHVFSVAIDSPLRIGDVQFNSDRRQGFGLITEHLIRLGYRRFAMIGINVPPGVADPTFWHAHGFISGVTEKLREAGLPEPVFEPFTRSSELTDNPHRGGELAMEALLKKGHRPEVVICSNDSFAIGALATCHRLGIRVPNDIAITGFQNELQSRYSAPPLTTVDAPVDLMMREVVCLIDRYLAGNRPSKNERFVYPCSLVVRQSCGAHPGVPTTSSRVPSEDQIPSQIP